MKLLNFETYRNKVYGCFLGKCVGGTLGMYYEGNLNYNPITYYDPVPTEMIPNDDLDLQVVNLESVLRSGLPISRYYIGETWKYHVAENAPDEYSVALSNNALKLFAPLSGIYRNKFYAGMGSAIRTELWACLAPANPSLAASFAREDACTDHYSDGVYAAKFLAAVESAAFVESDLLTLINIGMRFIPEEHRLKNAFNDVIEWWNQKHDVLKVRELILKKYGVDNWTDVTINLSFIILSLISCEGSFDKAICTATSLGYDADCTAATVGSIFGIINPDGIDEKWTKPIGDKLVLSPGIVNMHEPVYINDFCDTIISVASDVHEYYSTEVAIKLPATFKKAKISPPWTKFKALAYDWKDFTNESLVCVKPISVSIIYPDTVAALPNTDNKYLLRLSNTTDRNICGNVSLFLPEGFEANYKNEEFFIPVGETIAIPFAITLGDLKRRVPLNILTLAFTLNGMPFEVEAGIPVSMPWEVEDLKTGEKYTFEANSVYFSIPKGSYKFTAKYFASVSRDVRVSPGATRPYTFILNGEELKKSEGKKYVPAPHRGPDKFNTTIRQGLNTVEVIFDDAKEGEFFLTFANLGGCCTWIDSMERLV